MRQRNYKSSGSVLDGLAICSRSIGLGKEREFQCTCVIYLVQKVQFPSFPFSFAHIPHSTPTRTCSVFTPSPSSPSFSLPFFFSSSVFYTTFLWPVHCLPYFTHCSFSIFVLFPFFCQHTQCADHCLPLSFSYIFFGLSALIGIR